MTLCYIACFYYDFILLFVFIKYSPENPLPLGGGMNGVILSQPAPFEMFLLLCVYSYLISVSYILLALY